MAKKKKEEKYVGLTKTEALNKRLDDMEIAGMNRTKEWCEMWAESLRYFFSDQLHDKKNQKDWDWIIVNYIWPAAIQEIAKLSKNHPKILTSPFEDSDNEAAETWRGILQWLWEKGVNKRGMRLEQIAAILDGKIFGFRVSKVYWQDKLAWDNKNKKWSGDVKHRLWHPAEFWTSDNERIDDGACGTVRYVNLDWAISQWPNFETELQEEALKYKDIEGAGGDHIRGQLASPGLTSGTGGVDAGPSSNDPTRLLKLILKSDKMSSQRDSVTDEQDFVKISETYFYDYEEVDQQTEEDVPREELIESGAAYVDEVGLILDAKTKQAIPRGAWPKRVTEKWSEPVYPNGRYVIRCGHTILNPDEADQVYPYSRWPFIVTPHYLLPHMWQGIDAVQMYKTSQDMINVTVSHLVNNMKMFGNPRIAVEGNAIATNPKTKKAYKLLSGAGAILRFVSGGMKRFKIIDPVPPSAATLQLYQLFAQEFKNSTGLQDISQGKQGKTMTATETQYLAISSNDRIALQTAYEDEWVRQVAGMMAEICQRHYSPERMIRIVGEDGSVGVAQITQGMKDIRFDVDIIPGATLPFDEEKRINKFLTAYNLMAQPTPNPMLPEVLRVLEIPNWKKKLAEHQGWIQFMQFLQLYEAVKAGQVTPEEAMQMLVAEATKVFMQEQGSLQQKTQEGQTNQPKKGTDAVASGS